MNTRITYQPLNQTSFSLAAQAGRLLGKGMETNEVDDLTDAAADSFFAKTISAPLLNSKAAPDLCDQNGGWDLAFHMKIMMDIRGANP
ncbi:hypothetical protein [Undibacterium umbellatum]|uniref:Uncharacterized protein n=1 Tax=Undibacterium umbellatum TaxID=2762300 RepID=A0ABR6Z2Y2_9BURK|nr:hypothetical protein [Undibacterium umbellatum]MBC3906072.1 hypothetical protein [Undibacterium umbellatum]